MTLFTSIPKHQYCFVEGRFVANDDVALVPCVWFGLTSIPGRAWGLTVLLESGAIYSHLPPHALAFQGTVSFRGVPLHWDQLEAWSIQQAQRWDCFGVDFAVHEYAYLAGRTVHCQIVKRDGELLPGEYLFTAQHYGDGYSEEPEQAKQYHFVKLDNGRLTCLPANCLIVDATEFTVGTSDPVALPKGLRRQREKYTAE